MNHTLAQKAPTIPGTQKCGRKLYIQNSEQRLAVKSMERLYAWNMAPDIEEPHEVILNGHRRNVSCGDALTA